MTQTKKELLKLIAKQNETIKANEEKLKIANSAIKEIVISLFIKCPPFLFIEMS